MHSDPHPAAHGAVEHGAAAAIPVDQVHAELSRILESETFARSERLRRFLRLAVETTLQGRAGELKEYLFGVQVFDKGDSFDPRVDTIVRVEARRLRRKLDEYYRSEGRNDPLWIVLPKGTYVPTFRSKVQPPAAPEKALTLSGAVRRRRRLALLTGAAFLAVAALAAYLLRPRSSGPPALEQPAIVVLPFTNLSADPADEYFSHGLVEELTIALAKVEGLQVVARTSAYAFAGRTDDLAAIGERLRVNYLMEGSVRRSGLRLRITAQLIRAADQYHVWSEVYDRDLKDALQVQNEIATEIAQALKLRITAAPAGFMGRASEEEFAAYDLYLRGRYLRSQMTIESVTQSISFFEQAVERNPELVQAHVALADAFAMMGFHGIAPVEEVIPKARAAIGRAKSLDEANAKAHGVLGWVAFFYDRDWAESEAEFRRAIALDPGWSNVRQWFAFSLLARGRFAEAIEQSRAAIDLEPMSFIGGDDLAAIYYYSRQYDEAVRLARQSLDLNPGLHSAHGVLGMCLSAKGLHGEAIAEFEQVPPQARQVNAIVGRIGHAHAVRGNRAEARLLLRRLEQEVEGQPMKRCVERALICAGLDDRILMFDLLETAYRLHEGSLVFLDVEPIFDPYRRDPKFTAFLSKLGF